MHVHGTKSDKCGFRSGYYRNTIYGSMDIPRYSVFTYSYRLLRNSKVTAELFIVLIFSNIQLFLVVHLNDVVE